MDWKSWIAQIFDPSRFPLVMFLCGILLAACGAAGAVPSLITSIDAWGRIGFVAMGILIVTSAIFIYRTAQNKQPKPLVKQTFTITQPRTSSEQPMMNGFFDLLGTYKEEPQEGYSLAIIELIGGSKSFVFRREVSLNEQDKTWRASRVWGGMERTSQKEYAIVLVGRDGKALWDYWEKVGKKFKYEIPPIDTWPTDIRICDRVQFAAVNR
jgi:hypothetical protein